MPARIRQQLLGVGHSRSSLYFGSGPPGGLQMCTINQHFLTNGSLAEPPTPRITSGKAAHALDLVSEFGSPGVLGNKVFIGASPNEIFANSMVGHTHPPSGRLSGCRLGQADVGGCPRATNSLN